MREFSLSGAPPVSETKRFLEWVANALQQIANASKVDRAPGQISKALGSYYTAAQIDALVAGYQPLDDDLTAIAGLTTTEFGRSLLESIGAAALFAAVKQNATATATGVVEHASDAEVRAAAAGNLVVLASHLASAAEPVLLSYAASVDLDWGGFVNGEMVLTGDLELGTPTGGIPGTYRTLTVASNNSTGRTVTRASGSAWGGEDPGIAGVTNTAWVKINMYCRAADHFIMSAEDASPP